MSPLVMDQHHNKHLHKADAQAFYLVPTGPSIGLTSVSLGLIRALDRHMINVAFWKPITQPIDHYNRIKRFPNQSLHPSDENLHHQETASTRGTNDDGNAAAAEDAEPSTHFCRSIAKLGTASPSPLPFDEAEELWWNPRRRDELLQNLVATFQELQHSCDVVIVEGLQPTAHHPDLDEWNHVIVTALDAEVIIVSTMDEKAHASRCASKSSLSSIGTDSEDLSDDGITHDGWRACKERLEQVAQHYGGMDDPRVIGCILNGLKNPEDEEERKGKSSPFCARRFRPSLVESASIGGNGTCQMDVPAIFWTPERIQKECPFFNSKFRLLGAIPFRQDLMNPRTVDIQEHLGADVLSKGDIKSRRVSQICVVAMTLKNMAHRLSQPNTLILTPGDRDDVLVASCMAALNGTPLAGVVLTGDILPSPAIWKLCEAAFKTGLPILATKQDSFSVSSMASMIDTSVPADDIERMQSVMDVVAGYLEGPFQRLIQSRSYRSLMIRQPRMSPPAFLHRLVTQARANPQRIVLPEGDEPRVIQAACLCHRRQIAKCVLLGDCEEINRIACAQGLILPPDLEILSPDKALREKYVDAMVELRKHKGMSRPGALSQLEDVTVLGTMMLAEGHVDGLVSGANHSTANTVRPALQLIKTTDTASIVSSIFFMCLPAQVLIYGDCAINPDPTAEQLADIALQSAESAEAFGIDPRVAFISYSTGTSGQGNDVDKVRQATALAKARRPDLLMDGPLQYDAASTVDVAKSKAPDSQVAGKATVLIFPDLNTGNTTYKAVQRTADVVAIGPMLQGLKRPVNDLSRGARVEDILYTIALTAIQAQQLKSPKEAATTNSTNARTSPVPHDAVTEKAPESPKSIVEAAVSSDSTNPVA
mmetsp:Transcript_11583/g.33337  ORF Transcript_11583/g.33337 Transcript_11583/m.33337 type:complete len:879 (-) Transcript_11583:187-2823(-)|eukprot:CAMPEP_0119568588 /NCGR_PEP_ID=MMETSP1352-20130426/39324_1 /TAXON_ID=265584 /ORGANISM="Stauroneis constricta, Strain CCMP1120" /LENGTH=878 /DNA_ID=CAMNT_0007618021 /DNA_START=177 /DNA_END=2813 /DNA_ORIENTATION=+